LDRVIKQGIAVVTVGPEFAEARRIDFAGADDRGGGRQAGEHLMALGHRRVAFWHAGPSSRLLPGDSMAGRFRGFEEAVRAVPGTELIERVAGTDPLAAATTFLQSPERPTAVFAGDDRMAVVLYRAASELGLRIPQDLSVVGFGDRDLAGHIIPTLTTFSQDPVGIGTQAAEMLLKRISGDVARDEIQRFVGEPRLILRDSTTRA
jgi:LacI family transcriptional regulator